MEANGVGGKAAGPMLNLTRSPIPEYPSLRKLDDFLPLRDLAATTHKQYRRFARRLTLTPEHVN